MGTRNGDLVMLAPESLSARIPRRNPSISVSSKRGCKFLKFCESRDRQFKDDTAI